MHRLTPLTKILTSRFAISFFNVIITMITLSSLFHAYKLFHAPGNDFNQIEDLLDGISVIFVAYGVALEERDSLMSFFGLYPRYLSDIEEATDHLSHFYGLCILLLGLFTEVVVEVVKIPNTFFNTEGAEGLLFIIGFVFLCLGSILLLRLSYLLIAIKKPALRQAAKA